MGENKRAILKQAAQHVSWAELAIWLGVDKPLVEAWTLGTATMPERKFALVLDLLAKLGQAPVTPAVRQHSNVRELRRVVSPLS